MGGMKIIPGYPPNIEEIDAAFRVKGQKIIYAYGDRIYAANGANVTPEKVAHEAVHCARQLKFGMCADPELRVRGWWAFYISSPSFRLAEEIPAHIAEYVAMTASEDNRASRRRALVMVASQLGSALYGRLISYSEAKRVILAGAEAATERAMETA